MKSKNVKEEHSEHGDLMDLLKKHFSKDEKDIQKSDDEISECDKEEKSEKDDDEEEDKKESVPKEKRKRLAIAVITKRMSKPKQKAE